MVQNIKEDWKEIGDTFVYYIVYLYTSLYTNILVELWCIGGTFGDLYILVYLNTSLYTSILVELLCFGDTFGDGITLKVFMIRSGYSSRICSIESHSLNQKSRWLQSQKKQQQRMDTPPGSV